MDGDEPPSRRVRAGIARKCGPSSPRLKELRRGRAGDGRKPPGRVRRSRGDSRSSNGPQAYWHCLPSRRANPHPSPHPPYGPLRPTPEPTRFGPRGLSRDCFQRPRTPHPASKPPAPTLGISERQTSDSPSRCARGGRLRTRLAAARASRRAVRAAQASRRTAQVGSRPHAAIARKAQGRTSRATRRM